MGYLAYMLIACLLTNGMYGLALTIAEILGVAITDGIYHSCIPNKD